MVFGKDQKAKLSNWWWYHKTHVLLAAAALAIALYFAAQERGIERADYHVAVVCAERMTEDALSELSDALAVYGEDRNGDGKVTVRPHLYCLDLAAPEMSAERNSRADYTALEADFASAQSGIFLTDDPEAFQQLFGALALLDGSVPAENEPAEHMALRWGDKLWIGFRVSYDAGTAEKLSDDLALWTRLLQTI